MYDYIVNKEKYKYIPNIETDKLFTSNQNMSVPFAQGDLQPKPKQVLLCFVNSSEQDNWQKLVENKYTSMPVLANDTSIQKITFIQIQKYKLNETQYGDKE